MQVSPETDALVGVLRQSSNPQVVAAIERLLTEGPDHELCRINALAFAAKHGFNEEDVIAAFLHAARLGIFELSWNVLCPGCGGVLDASATLKTVHQEAYHCQLCAAGYEPTLDEMVEVTFTVHPRARRIAAHDPHSLPPFEYMRQVFWSSGVDLPENAEQIMQDLTLESIELPAGEKALLSLNLPAEFTIVGDPVTHTMQFIDVKGEPTRERQALTVVFNKLAGNKETVTLRPGPLRLSLENRAGVRVLPALWRAGDALHDLLGRRRPFVTAKRLLSNQTFRDVYGTATLDVDQRLKITSLTFLFTDLRGSTALYERVGDIAAYDLVRAHFQVLNEIVARQAGAVVKTIGDAVMATFPTPERAIEAALKMREAMDRLNRQRGEEELLLKIGIHEGPCLAVTLNDRQDYFGQTVNIASRVQNLATEQAIFATGQVVAHSAVSKVLETSGITPVPHDHTLRGITNQVTVYEIP